MENKDRIKELELEKLKETELIKWFEGLYEQETFEIEKMGKVFKFNQHYSVETATKIAKLDKVLQTKYLISTMSIKPKITMKAVEKMDSAFLGKIGLKIKEYNDILGKNKGTSEKKLI